MNSNDHVRVHPKARNVYDAGVLRACYSLDRRDGSVRRFGPDADSWRSLGGAPSDSNRVEFLLRDAAATWESGFAHLETLDLFSLVPVQPIVQNWHASRDAHISKFHPYIPVVDQDVIACGLMGETDLAESIRVWHAGEEGA